MIQASSDSKPKIEAPKIISISDFLLSGNHSQVLKDKGMKALWFLSLVLVGIFGVARGIDGVLPGNAVTAQLKFCKGRGGFFSFRLPGKPCEGSAPAMRIEAGKTYRLILRDVASKTVTNIHTHGLHMSSEGFPDDITQSKQ